MEMFRSWQAYKYVLLNLRNKTYSISIFVAFVFILLTLNKLIISINPFKVIVVDVTASVNVSFDPNHWHLAHMKKKNIIFAYTVIDIMQSTDEKPVDFDMGYLLGTKFI